MTDQIVTNRQQNRTHLQRQHLLNRSSMRVGDMLREIIGLQAQDVKDPYLALWSRIDGFQHQDLASMLENRTAVRASLMRGTIHLVTSDDYLSLFPVTYQLHLRAVHSVSSARLVPRKHHDAIASQARTLLQEQTMTAAHIGEALMETWPEFEPRSLSQVVRFLLPLIQTPPRGVWGPGISSRPTWTLPGGWLSTDVPEEVAPPHDMIRRYLRAFGPASLADITAWSGVTNLKQPLLELSDELVRYRDEWGVTLYDLAALELTSGEIEAPVRFLPGFDNALLGHKDRRRIISDHARAAISTQNGMFASTFLVDGFVAGIWRAVDGAIELAAFESLTNDQRQDVEQEAERLSPFWTGEELSVTWVDV